MFLRQWALGLFSRESYFVYYVSLLRVLGFSVSPFGVVGVCFCTGQVMPSILPIYWGFPSINSFCA